MSELFSISKLADLFGLDRRTVTKRLNGVHPCGQKSGHPAYTIKKAAPYLVAQTVAYADGGEMNPDELPPDLRDKHYAAEMKKREIQKADGDLIERADLTETLSFVFKTLDNSCELLPDEMAIKFDWSPDELQQCQDYIDTWRQQIHVALNE